MKLPYTEVILYPEVKSQTSLSSLQVSCKHAVSDKIRSSHPEAFCKKGVQSNFAKFKVKHMCQSLLFNKVAGLRLWHRCFPANFVKFLRPPFFIEHLWWLLLQIYRMEEISDIFFYTFKPFSILNFAMAEWFCHITCFSKVYLILFFFLVQTYFWVFVFPGPGPGPRSWSQICISRPWSPICTCRF